MKGYLTCNKVLLFSYLITFWTIGQKFVKKIVGFLEYIFEDKKKFF